MNAYQIPADPTAVVGRRIAAYIIDAIIGMAVFVVMLLAVGDHATFPTSERAADACDIARDFGEDPVLCFNAGDQAWAAEGGDAVMIIGVSFLAGVVNHIILAGTVGGSLGKLAMSLRIVKKDTGRVAGIGPNIIRTLLWIVDAFPYCFPLVGLITGLATKGHRRVGDMAAGTLVVNKAALGRPPMVPGLTGPATAAAAAGYGSTPAGGWGAPPVPPAPPSWGAPVPPPPADPWAQPAAPSPSPTADPWTPPPPPAPTQPEVSEPEPAPFAAPEPQPAPVFEPAPEPEDQPAAPVFEPAPEPEAQPAAPETPATETPGVGAPTWDAARNAYIQWDPSLNSWMQWDDAAQQWRPIS